MNYCKIVFVFFFFGLLCVILVFLIISWMELFYNGLKIYIGLWCMCLINCLDFNGIVLCKNLKISLIILEGGEVVIYVF